MDKHLHNDIGDQFSNEINRLSQQPREHIWENIDKALDKTEVSKYKNKFTRLKKKTLLLLLLLLGISTFSIIYFNTSKNKNTPHGAVHNGDLAAHKNIEKLNNDNNYKVISKQDITEINNNAHKQIVAIAVTDNAATKTKEEDLFTAGKLFISQKGKTKIKISDPVLEEIISDAEPENNKDRSIEKEKGNIALTISISPIDSQKNVSVITPSVKKDNNRVTASQSSTKTNKKQLNNYTKFTLTAFAAPDYTAYRLENDERSNYDNKTGIKKRERSDLSSSVSILLGYKTGSKISIQSGLIYSSSNISISPTKIYAEKENDGKIKYRYNTSSGYGYLLPSFSSSPAVGDSLFANGANHTLHYFSIPIIAKYKLGGKKITFYPGVGVTFNFLTKATLTTDVQDRFNTEKEYITKLESIKKISTGLVITPEVQYQLSKNWSISAMPYFKYSLGAINKGNVVKTYPYTFGLGIGAAYTF